MLCTLAGGESLMFMKWMGERVRLFESLNGLKINPHFFLDVRIWLFFFLLQWKLSKILLQISPYYVLFCVSSLNYYIIQFPFPLSSSRPLQLYTSIQSKSQIRRMTWFEWEKNSTCARWMAGWMVVRTIHYI